VTHHDLSLLGFNFAVGLSNGAIWALIAIGTRWFTASSS